MAAGLRQDQFEDRVLYVPMVAVRPPVRLPLAQPGREGRARGGRSNKASHPAWALNATLLFAIYDEIRRGNELAAQQIAAWPYTPKPCTTPARSTHT